jgi:hypothetical protein
MQGLPEKRLESLAESGIRVEVHVLRIPLAAVEEAEIDTALDRVEWHENQYTAELAQIAS